MSKPKPKRNKKYRPGAYSVPITIRHGADDDRVLMLVPHTCLDDLKRGSQDNTNWNTITARLNVSLVISKALCIPDVQTSILNALDAICDVRGRFDRVGRWGVNEEEEKLIGAGLVLADDIQKQSTRREMRDAIRYVFSEATI